MRIEVSIWGITVGFLKESANSEVLFQYTPEWIDTGIELSPIRMPLSRNTYCFRELLGTDTFSGLPGLIADALPEKFGNAILKSKLSMAGKNFESLSPLERLSYLGTRGMGALEFKPDLGGGIGAIPTSQDSISIEVLASVAQDVLASKSKMTAKLDSDHLDCLVQIGTSAGGAKAKAVIGWNSVTNDVVAGQGALPDGYEHWLLKFDGIENEEHASVEHIGRIEYAYALMASDQNGCGIRMTDHRLFETNNSAHFMIKRFDRSGNSKFHVQSYCAIDHADRNPVGQYSYEELFLTMRKLGLPQEDRQEMYRRMVFNIAARNQDDHTKNHAFIMDASGEWRLTPAYDLCFAYKKGNRFIDQHQMRCNAKRDAFDLDDLLATARTADIQNPMEIIDQVRSGIESWMSYANKAGLAIEKAKYIESTFRKSALMNDALSMPTSKDKKTSINLG